MNHKIHPDRMGNVSNISTTICGFNMMYGHCVLCPEMRSWDEKFFELETEMQGEEAQTGRAEGNCELHLEHENDQRISI